MREGAWMASCLSFFVLQDASNLFLVMEFLQGGSLSTHITRHAEQGNTKAPD